MNLITTLTADLPSTLTKYKRKRFRRSNKYLLRRYKRNMFRVVFRRNGVEHGSQEMETQYHHSLHCSSWIDRKEEDYLH